LPEGLLHIKGLICSFMNEERLAKILNNDKMPVQIVIAGKAHPKDDAGKNILKQIIHTMRKPEFKDK